MARRGHAPGRVKILFLHPNFPAQFRDLAVLLAADRRNTVAFGTACETGELPGVQKVLFRGGRKAGKGTHHYLRGTEAAVRLGQEAARLGIGLIRAGFVPDVICGHSGWGPMLFMKDIFPKARLLGYFEWFYRAHGSDADFDPAETLTLDDEARLRTKNAPILLDLAACDAGSCPTEWQRAQFPRPWAEWLNVCHDGIDTDYFSPVPGAKLVLPRIGLDLSEAAEVVTYVSRGFEPYRGFPQFIAALDRVLRERPRCHAVIVGEDRVAYGKTLPGGETWKTKLLREYPLDPARVHFTGPLPYVEYVQVLRASSAHVYLTRPFVLSWSLLEAMSAGCAIVASATAPVLEVMRDGENGLLTDFFDVPAIARRMSEALDAPHSALRARARETIVQHYSARRLLPQRAAWLLGRG